MDTFLIKKHNEKITSKHSSKAPAVDLSSFFDSTPFLGNWLELYPPRAFLTSLVGFQPIKIRSLIRSFTIRTGVKQVIHIYL